MAGCTDPNSFPCSVPTCPSVVEMSTSLLCWASQGVTLLPGAPQDTGFRRMIWPWLGNKNDQPRTWSYCQHFQSGEGWAVGQGWQCAPPALGSQTLLWLQLERGSDHLGLPWAPETTPKALPQVL